MQAGGLPGGVGTPHRVEHGAVGCDPKAVELSDRGAIGAPPTRRRLDPCPFQFGHPQDETNPGFVAEKGSLIHGDMRSGGIFEHAPDCARPSHFQAIKKKSS